MGVTVDPAERPKVFISYARSDSAALAEELVTGLELAGFEYVNQTLLRWAMRKFKRFKAHKIRASHFLQRLGRDGMGPFVHWQIGMTGTFA